MQKPPLTEVNGGGGVPDRIRTCDLWYRKPVLYPLSYGDSAVIRDG